MLRLLTLALALSGTPAVADAFKECADSSKPDLQIKSCSEIIDANPSCRPGDSKCAEARSIVHMWRGKAYESTRDFSSSMSDYDKSIALDPRNARAHGSRGYLFWLQQRYDSAIADYSKAIEINPKFATVYYLRGLAHSSGGDQDKAIVDFTKAVELNPKYYHAYIDRGESHEKKGDKQSAIADFRRALDVKPDEGAAIAGLQRLGVSK